MTLLEDTHAVFARRPALLPLAIGCFALFFTLPGIGVGDFVGDDEALDAGVVTEMVRSGDWLFPEFNGEYLPPKPPLFYWAAALTSKLHGRVDEWSLRLPSAVAGGATVTVTVAGATRMVGPGPAALAGFLLAVMPVTRGESRLGRCDMTMALLVTACLFLFRAPPGAVSRSRRWLFYSLLGLAALAKGGAGVGLVVVVIVADALVARQAGTLRSLVDPALLAFFVVGGSWYAAAAWHWGERFIDQQIIGENLHHLLGGAGISDRGSGERGAIYHLGFYGLHLFLVTLPWGFLLPGALRDSLSREQRQQIQFFVVWLVAGLVFFSLAARKSPYYLLPLAPAVAVLTATWSFGWVKSAFETKLLDRALSLRSVAALLAASATVWAVPFMAWSPACEVSAVRTSFALHPIVTMATVVVLVTSAASALGALATRRWGVALSAIWLTALAFLTLSNLAEGRIDNCSSLRSFAEAVRERTAKEDHVFFFRMPLPAVALYSGRRIPTLRDGENAPPRPFYLIVPESLAREVPGRWLDDSQEVAASRGRVFTRRPMAIRLLRVGETSRSLPIGEMGPGEGDEVRVEPAIRRTDARVRDMADPPADRERVVFREEEMKTASSLRAELEVASQVQPTQRGVQHPLATLDEGNDREAEVIAIVEDQRAQGDLVVGASIVDRRSEQLDR